jgi:hypothetical protein
MKTRTLSPQQLVILIAVVVALVFGVTYASMMIGRGKDKTTIAYQEDLLTFLSADPKANGREMPREESEREVFKPGHYDFWFHNPKDSTVVLGPVHKNCQCAKLEFALLPQDQWGKGDELLKSSAKMTALADSLSWQELVEQGNTVTVPAGATGGLRVSWHIIEQPEYKKIEANLLTRDQDKDKAGAQINLLAMVNFVEPVRVFAEKPLTPERGPAHPNEAWVGDDMKEGSVETATFFCCSSTRAQFKLKMDKWTDSQGRFDPCVTCSEPEPMTKKELERYSLGQNSPMLSGYRLTATVRERTKDGKAQLDIGYFRRYLKLNLDPDERQTEAVVSGLVRGPLEVGEGDDKNVIRLGNFPAVSVARKVMTIRADHDDMELDVDGWEPKFLAPPKLALIPKAVGGKTWELTVTVPPNSAPVGELPYESAVYLKIRGESGRRIRIPIRGAAYGR